MMNKTEILQQTLAQLERYRANDNGYNWSLNTVCAVGTLAKVAFGIDNDTLAWTIARDSKESSGWAGLVNNNALVVQALNALDFTNEEIIIIERLSRPLPLSNHQEQVTKAIQAISWFLERELAKV
jgi:hypothetical protein